MVKHTCIGKTGGYVGHTNAVNFTFLLAEDYEMIRSIDQIDQPIDQTIGQMGSDSAHADANPAILVQKMAI